MDNGSYKFDIQVQKKFLALLFQDFSFLSTNGTEIIKPEYFDTIYLRNVARWIIDYFTQYQTKPTTEVLITELDNYSAKTKVSEIDREQYIDLSRCSKLTSICLSMKWASFWMPPTIAHRFAHNVN